MTQLKTWVFASTDKKALQQSHLYYYSGNRSVTNNFWQDKASKETNQLRVSKIEGLRETIRRHFLETGKCLARIRLTTTAGEITTRAGRTAK